MELTEKQKNCQFCHYPWKKIPVKGIEEDDEALCYEQYESGWHKGLIKTTNVLGKYDTFPSTLFINYAPKFCEQCGRPLNKEEK